MGLKIHCLAAYEFESRARYLAYYNKEKNMARSRIILEKGMLLGEGQLKFVREIEGKTYPSGVYER